MEQVEDVLRTLLGPDDRFRTVRATIRHSRDVDLERRSAGIGRPSLGRDNIESGGGSKSPRIATSVAKIWLNRPGWARIEERREVGGGIERNLTVIDGPRRWERYSDGRVEMNECEARSEMASANESFDIITDRHFNPEQIRGFLEVLTLKPMGAPGSRTVIVSASERCRDRGALRGQPWALRGVSLWALRGVSLCFLFSA